MNTPPMNEPLRLTDIQSLIQNTLSNTVHEPKTIPNVPTKFRNENDYLNNNDTVMKKVENDKGNSLEVVDATPFKLNFDPDYNVIPDHLSEYEEYVNPYYNRLEGFFNNTRPNPLENKTPRKRRTKKEMEEYRRETNENTMMGMEDKYRGKKKSTKK